MEREYRMKSFRLRVAAIVAFSSFAATSGAFASSGNEAEISAEGVPLGMDSDQQNCYAETCMCDPTLKSTENVDPLVSNPAEYQRCMTACKGGSAAMFRYCNVFLDPRVKALCIIAAGGSFVACSGFCYARFMD
jgi:hypothetical protein